MKKNGFILPFALLILIGIGILIVSLRQIRLARRQFRDHFFHTQQELLLRYSIRELSITPDIKLTISNNLGQTFQLN